MNTHARHGGVVPMKPTNAYLRGWWFAHPDDLIGGWCVMPLDQPPSSTTLPEIASGLTEEIARHIAALHNQWLVWHGGRSR